MAVPLAVILYLKMIINGFYIGIKSKVDVKRRIILYIKAIGNIFLGPFVIVLSLIIDLLNLNSLLMREQKFFEYKYQKNRVLDDEQVYPTMKAFMRIFISEFERKYKNASRTEYSLMFNHRKIFNVVSNFHSLFCRGDKNYEQSVQDIKVYNLTKILAARCSIPNRLGDKKQDFLNYEVMNAIFEDQIMYNYF